MTAAANQLPKGFEDLEKHVEYWAKPTENERRLQRDGSDIETIKSYYDDMIGRVEPALEYLNTRDMNAFDEAETKLFSLTLSLAEIAPCVEWYNQVRVIDGVVPERYEVDTVIRKRLAREVNEGLFI